MNAAVSFWPSTPLLFAVLFFASWTDLRRREVPAWLSLGAIASGLLAAAVLGQGALLAAALGLVVGALPMAPFVALGGFGGADLLLVTAVGVWEGWSFTLWTVFWMALVGAGFALIARHRGQKSLPYVLAIAVGALLAYLSSLV